MLRDPAALPHHEQPPPPAPATPTERPRQKKLSFRREPEIFGQINQLKQRLSGRSKTRPKSATAASDPDGKQGGASGGGTPPSAGSGSGSGSSGGRGFPGRGGGAGGGAGAGAGGDGGDGNDYEEDCRSIRLSSSMEDLELENQAMRVVRTVGQAFEVCHKLSIGPNSPVRDRDRDDQSERDSEAASDKPIRKGVLHTQTSVDGIEDSIQDSASYDASPKSPPPRSLRLDLQLPRTSPQNNHRKDICDSPERERERDREREREPSAGALLHHEVQLLREQLEQQVQQTHAALAQVSLLRDQLAAERVAREDAQTRTHLLLGHNRELLDHITSLVSHLQQQEGGTATGLQLPPMLSSSDKVSRWFDQLQLLQAGACSGSPLPLSRPESGFVSGAQSGDITVGSGCPGSAVEVMTEGDAEDPISAALGRLPARKKNKLLKLKLGRNVTF